MNREEALAKVKPYLTMERYQHTIGVTDTAIHLAERYNGDIEKAMLASVFHDYCKYRNLDEMKMIIEDAKLPRDLLDHHSELWHGPVASIMIEEEIGITDPEIKSAIYWHTTGHSQMSLLEKIVYLADYIEPNRLTPRVDDVRKIAEIDIDQAILMVVKSTIVYLVENQKKVYPDTLNLFNDLI